MTDPAVQDRRPACTSCHKAKRKCNKNTPACLRCEKQNILCEYPRQKPTAFAPIDFFGDIFPSEDDFDLAALDNSFDLLSQPAMPLITHHTGLSLEPSDRYSGSWFLEPETWLIDHSTIPIPPNFKMWHLKDFVGRLQKWLEEWVKMGGNCFIHPELYQDRFPACVQVAFATLSAYVHRTPATSDIVMRTVVDQAGELGSSMKKDSMAKLDVLDILAQAHSLLVYHVIGLLDGDFRARRFFEERCSVFVKLLGTLHDKSADTLRQSVLEAEFDDIANGISTPARMVHREWQAWIVSESVRRTWLLGTGFHAAYEGLTGGETVCGGDLACTTREGIWEADGAYAWSKLCIEKDVRFIGRFRAEWLFNMPPSEVDEFSKMMLEITYGKDRMALWLAP